MPGPLGNTGVVVRQVRDGSFGGNNRFNASLTLWSLTLSVCGIILQKHKSARLHIVPINNVFLSELERMDLNASVKITNMAPSTRLQLPAVLTLAMMGQQICGECENDKWIGNGAEVVC